jgi:4-diphosphocytidyl-2C-methyl-D-erythritol kinase
MGIQAGEFGKIGIHTSVSQGQISARIYVEHNDLGKAISEALPQLHEKLTVEHRMEAQIQLYNTGSGSSYGTEQQKQQQQQKTQEQNLTGSQDADEIYPAEVAQELTSSAAAGGLDMHA